MASEVAAQHGSFHVMPRQIADSGIEAKKAWVVGLLTGMAHIDSIELKDVSAEKSDKAYEKLEIHHHSPQVYAVVAGSIAVPAASTPEADAVRFYRVNRGEALVVGPGVWHGGPVGLDGTANVVVALREGTSEGDTLKQPVSPTVRFTPSGGRGFIE